MFCRKYVSFIFPRSMTNNQFIMNHNSSDMILNQWNVFEYQYQNIRIFLLKDSNNEWILGINFCAPVLRNLISLDNVLTKHRSCFVDFFIWRSTAYHRSIAHQNEKKDYPLLFLYKLWVRLFQSWYFLWILSSIQLSIICFP